MPGHVRYAKAYGILFVVLLLLIALFHFFYPEKIASRESSQEISSFKQAEADWNETMRSEKALQEYLAEKPFLRVLYALFSATLIGVFGFGLIFDGLFIASPRWRRSWVRPPPSENPVWSFAMIAKVAVLWILVGAFLTLLFYALHYAKVRISSNAAALFHTTAMQVTALVLIYHVLRETGNRWKDLGFSIPSKQILREIGAGLMAYLAILPVFLLVILIMLAISKLLAQEPPPHPLVEIFLEEGKRSPFLVFYSVILASVLGPVVEEVFFRGFCYNIVKAKWGRIAAAIGTAFAFAWIHQNQFSFIPIFILGLALAFLYEARKNLWAPMTLHVAHNVFFMAYFFIAKTMISDYGNL